MGTIPGNDFVVTVGIPIRQPLLMVWDLGTRELHK